MKTTGFILVAALVSCADGPSTAPTAQDLTISSNTVTAFDATFKSEGDWARVQVEYSPSTTFYFVTSSFGSAPLSYAGTAHAEQALLDQIKADPRQADGYVYLQPSDLEYPAVKGLYDALMAAGATSKPDPATRGSTMYAAAYTVARIIGEVHLRSPDSTETGLPSVWPYPGYSPELLPPELQATSGLQSIYNFHCCGPMDCGSCQYNSNACDDWCAAGDTCNDIGFGGCGSICPGVACPHSDSTTIKNNGTGPCNTKPKNFCYHFDYVQCH